LNLMLDYAERGIADLIEMQRAILE
jgi:hypothetical protein